MLGEAQRAISKFFYLKELSGNKNKNKKIEENGTLFLLLKRIFLVKLLGFPK